MKEITDMLRKGNEIKWPSKVRYLFEQIKKYLCETFVLIILDYTEEFLIFPFASKNNIVVVLLQKHFEGFEQPIAFFSSIMRDVELKYNILEKHAYTLVRDLKSFISYVLHSKVISYVSNSIIKEILSQRDNDGSKGNGFIPLIEEIGFVDHHSSSFYILHSWWSL